MDRHHELKDFFRSRRARPVPPGVGLPWRLGAREELAQVADVDVTPAEQARARNVSDQVLATLADALRFDDVERGPLRAPARPVPVAASVLSMVEALDPTPALVNNAVMDVLAINRMAAILFDSLTLAPPGRCNLARWTFLDPRSREVLGDWEPVGRSMVASLRRAVPTWDDNPLISELSAGSADFARWWAEADLASGHTPQRFHHDLVGDVELGFQSLVIPQEPDQFLCLYFAPHGSAAQEKLSLLSTWDPTPGVREPFGEPRR